MRDPARLRSRAPPAPRAHGHRDATVRRATGAGHHAGVGRRLSPMPARYTRIIGTGSALPARAVTNDELARDLAARGIETSDEWIVARTGIRQRYIAEPGLTTSALGARAARAALTDANVDARSIDLLIVATSTTDQIFPSTAC